MGIEALNSAAWAAGFAMAASDEPYAEVKVEEARAAETQWRPGEAMLPREVIKPTPRAGDWVRNLLGLFGRRVPVPSA
jgi:hypothetical protein